MAGYSVGSKLEIDLLLFALQASHQQIVRWTYSPSQHAKLQQLPMWVSAMQPVEQLTALQTHSAKAFWWQQQGRKAWQCSLCRKVLSSDVPKGQLVRHKRLRFGQTTAWFASNSKTTCLATGNASRYHLEISIQLKLCTRSWSNTCCKHHCETLGKSCSIVFLVFAAQ